MGSFQELLQRVRASRFRSDGHIRAPAVLGFDLLARLPMELHVLILEYLDTDDILVALNSSKVLRIVWLSDEVWPWLADRSYPDLSSAIRVEAAQRGAMSGRLSALEFRTGYHYGGEHPMKSKKKGSRPVALGSGELFRQMLVRLCRRKGGRFRSALHHQMHLVEDPIFALSKELPPDQGGVTSIYDLDEDLLGSAKFSGSRFMLYHNGRVAWWPSSYSAPYIAVVDDFRTLKRRIYRFPDHDGAQQGYKTAMSDELLVIAKQTSIHAWHFDKDLLCSTVVPEQLERCVVEGSDVLIVTRSAELYNWRFGGPLQRTCLNGIACYQPGPVRMGGLIEAPLQSHSPMFHIPRRQGLMLKDNGMLLDFIIHPSLRDVLFVVTMYEGELVVHEIHEGKSVESYPFAAAGTPPVGQWNNTKEYLRWERCDSYGGYCLFSVYLGVDDELAPSDLQMPDQPFCKCEQKTGLVSVCFNIYTKAYRVICHHFLHSYNPQTAPVPAAFHLWQSQLYTSYAPEDMRAGVPVIALQCCLDVQERRRDEASDAPIFTISEGSQGRLLRRQKSVPGELFNLPESRLQRDLWRKQVIFGLDINARRTSNPAHSQIRTLWDWDTPNVHQKQTIVGDDDFLIYMVDGVYLAWSFGNEIPPPKEVAKWTLWNNRA